MADKLMYIPNDDTQNYTFRRLNLLVETFKTQLNEPTNQSPLKSPKLLSQRIRKRYYKYLGTGVINSPISPLLPCNSTLPTIIIVLVLILLSLTHFIICTLAIVLFWFYNDYEVLLCKFSSFIFTVDSKLYY